MLPGSTLACPTIAGYHLSSMNRTSRRITCIGMAIGLIALLLVVGASLQSIKLAPAQPMTPLHRPQPPIAGGTQGSAGSTAVPLLIHVMLVLALVSLAFLIISAIFHKEPRSYLLGLALACLMVFGGYQLLRYLTGQAEQATSEIVYEPLTLGRVDAQAERLTEDAPAGSPSWAVVALALLISISVSVLLLLLWRKLAPYWGRSRERDTADDLSELVDTVASAADEIQLGGDPRAAVLRCYRDMVRILCQRRTVQHAYLTARELAGALRAAGFTTQHVDQLTEIFELVRYGHRSAQPLAKRAIACLEAIREAYA